ncbi:substrate-binding periplasmic protein [Bdellovibrio bacteriovorus]
MFAVLLAALLLWNTPGIAKTKSGEATLKYGVNSNYAMPLVEVRRTQDVVTLEGGILKDLGEAIYKELKLPLKVYLVPKRRVAPSLVSGNVAIVCHLNEVWQLPIKNDVLWSVDLYRSTNLIVYLGNKPVQKIKDLQGERVGTVLNFVYQVMDEYFKKGGVIREDAPNNDANIQKLINGRISYAIMSNLEFAYYKKMYPALESADLGLDTVMTKCALSKKQDIITIDELNKALSSIKKSGQLDRILKSYSYDKKAQGF